MLAQVRTGLTHAGTALGGAFAAIAFLSQHKVDLYALWDQLNVIVAELTKFIALVTPIATGAYGIYKARTAQKLVDIVADPLAVEKAAELPVTPQTVALAEALTKG